MIVETPVGLSSAQKELLEKFEASLTDANTPRRKSCVERAGKFMRDSE